MKAGPYTASLVYQERRKSIELLLLEEEKRVSWSQVFNVVPGKPHHLHLQFDQAKDANQSEFPSIPSELRLTVVDEYDNATNFKFTPKMEADLRWRVSLCFTCSTKNRVISVSQCLLVIGMSR